MQSRVEDYLLDLILPAGMNPSAGDSGGEIDEFAKYRLSDEAHLHVFGFWYEMGGPRQPLTPQQAAEMPATLARDFRLLMRLVKELKFENGVEDGDSSATSSFEESLRAGGIRKAADGFLVRSVGYAD